MRPNPGEMHEIEDMDPLVRAAAYRTGGVMDKGTLDLRFDHHPPDEATAQLHDQVRLATKNYVSTTLAHLGNSESRELSLFTTKMEEALFWLNAHIARHRHG